jgi:hypothetical protein
MTIKAFGLRFWFLMDDSWVFVLNFRLGLKHHDRTGRICVLELE